MRQNPGAHKRAARRRLRPAAAKRSALGSLASRRRTGRFLRTASSSASPSTPHDDPSATRATASHASSRARSTLLCVSRGERFRLQPSRSPCCWRRSPSTWPTGPADTGNPKQGEQLFLDNRILCGSCHTLKAARATGRDGPNLDRAKPGYARIVTVVTKGRNPTKRWPTGMPFYSGKHALLSKAQVRHIAAFVYNATHK